MGTNAPVDHIKELEKLTRVCFNSLVSGSYLPILLSTELLYETLLVGVSHLTIKLLFINCKLKLTLFGLKLCIPRKK